MSVAITAFSGKFGTKITSEGDIDNKKMVTGIAYSKKKCQNYLSNMNEEFCRNLKRNEINKNDR